MQASAHTYQSVPQPVPMERPKYREKKLSLMSDRRVVRGNTYAASITSLNQLAAQAKVTVVNQLKTQQQVSTVKRPRKKTTNMVPQRMLSETGLVYGNPSVTAQTEDYLEDLVDVTSQANMGSQTDDVDEEKPLPIMFVPKPMGVDKQTLIESTELFDFRMAVRPVLEVLIGKSVDQSVTEVMEEEELKNIQTRTKRFQEERDIMNAEAQKLEAANMRRYEEKEKRLSQERERRAAQLKFAAKLAATTNAREYLSGLQDKVFRRLEKEGLFFDPTAHDVQSTFLPWLTVRVAKKIDALGGARSLIDQFVMDSFGKVQFVLDERARVEKERVDAIERARLLEIKRKEEEEERLKKEAADKEQVEKDAALLAEAEAAAAQ